MIIEFKPWDTNKNWGYPQSMSTGAAGFDLTASWTEVDKEKKILTVHYNIAVAIPPGYVGLLVPRSSIYKHSLLQANSIGVIDSDYRGELMHKFKFEVSPLMGSVQSDLYKEFDRTGQLLIVEIPKVVWKRRDSLDDTERGEGGFGSTNKELEVENLNQVFKKVLSDLGENEDFKENPIQFAAEVKEGNVLDPILGTIPDVFPTKPSNSDSDASDTKDTL